MGTSQFAGRPAACFNFLKQAAVGGLMMVSLIVVFEFSICSSLRPFGLTCSQIVVVESRIEDQEEAALGLMSPHWIIRKHHNVTLTNRNINDCGSAGQFIAAGQLTADQQVIYIG